MLLALALLFIGEEVLDVAPAPRRREGDDSGEDPAVAGVDDDGGGGLESSSSCWGVVDEGDT